MATEFEKKKVRHASGESTTSTDSVSHYIPTPPDGGWGWVIVFASFINHVLVDGISFTFGVFYIEFLNFYGESKAKTSLAGSLLCGFYLMSGPIAGALTNKFGCRPVCIAGSLFAAASFVLCTFSPNLDMLLVTYGVMAGIGFGLMYLPSVISVSYYFERRRAMATGIAVCGAGVGTFVFAPVGGAMLDNYDWKNAMLIVAALVLNGCICGMLMRPLEAPKRKKPRAKNVLDRLKEHAMSSLRGGENRKESECSTCAKAHEDNILKLVQEAKLAREEALKDDESVSEAMSSLPSLYYHSVRKSDSLPSTRNNSIILPGTRKTSQVSQPESRVVSRQGSISINPIMEDTAQPQEDGLPRIVIEAPADHEEKPLMNQIDEEKSSAEGSDHGDSKTHSHTDIDKTTTEKGKKHVKLIDTLNHNGNLPNGNACEHRGDGEDSKPHDTTALLKAENNMKSLSAHDVCLLAVRPKPRMRRPPGVEKSDYARPLYRKDIFYSGSILQIPQFRSQPDVNTYVKSITDIPDGIPAEDEKGLWRCLRIPKAAKDILKEMLDVTILADPVFLICGLGNLFGMTGLYVPFVYIVERSMDLGVTSKDAAFLLSVIGITNTVGRLLAGLVADFKCINTLLMHNIAILLGGFACILNMFCTTYPLMCLFAAFFGLCVATWISMTSIVLVNLLGLQKLTNAFGLLALIRGIAIVIGPPAAGMVFDVTKDYNSSFHVGGAMLVLAGLLHCTLHLPYFTRRQKKLQTSQVVEVEVDASNVPLPPDFDDPDLNAA